MDIKELTKLANHLDSKGLRKEADVIDSFIKDEPMKPGSYRNRNNSAPEKKTVEQMD